MNNNTIAILGLLISAAFLGLFIYDRNKKSSTHECSCHGGSHNNGSGLGGNGTADPIATNGTQMSSPSVSNIPNPMTQA